MNPGTGGDLTPPRTYCTDPFHGNGQHSAACMPPAEPGNPELRLLRAIFGLCGLCDRTEEHEHESGETRRYYPDEDRPGDGCPAPGLATRLRHRWFIWINFKPHWWQRP